MNNLVWFAHQVFVMFYSLVPRPIPRFSMFDTWALMFYTRNYLLSPLLLQTPNARSWSRRLGIWVVLRELNSNPQETISNMMCIRACDQVMCKSHAMWWLCSVALVSLVVGCKFCVYVGSDAIVFVFMTCSYFHQIDDQCLVHTFLVYCTIALVNCM